jgi:Putative peptidoglycan binding domain
MKKIITLLTVCVLGCAGALVAQEPQESPPKKGARPEKNTHATPGKPVHETKPTHNATKQTTPETGTKQHGAKREYGAETENNPNAAQLETGKKGRHGGNATTNTAAAIQEAQGAGSPVEHGKKGRKGRGETATTSATPAPNVAGKGTPATTNKTTAANTAGTNLGPSQGTVGRGGKKVEQQQVQQIKQQHANFKAQPRPDKAPAVTFNANHRIEGAQNWQGSRYEVFRDYHSEWHDQGWYHSHYGRVELIGGGWYFWNAGYWFPAWGYDPGVAYYPYDGPIYVGQRAEPPDRVIADVQAELQDMGYYTGDVDGLLGPLTRQALRDYQADHGLAVTEAIDEPTLDALQMS